MNTRYALLAACWLLLPTLAHAQRVNCPAPANITVTQLTATSATLSIAGSTGRGSLYGSYSYPGSATLVATRVSPGVVQLPNIPPATLITASLFYRCIAAIPEEMSTTSPTTIFTFTTPTALAARDASALATLELSPNPAYTTATLRLPHVPMVTQATLRLLDALGRLVRTDLAPLGKSYELPLAGLSSGVYFVQVQAGEALAVRRLVVQ